MIPESTFPDANLLERAVEVLMQVEALPPDATGALRFAGSGSVLVEAGRVCWAAASTMEQRLTDLLRHQRNPPLDKTFLESVLADCQRHKRPIGEALLASGEISEVGLRTALFRQTVEAIAHIAKGHAVRAEFIPHTGAAYDARFLFCTAEIFAALGARRDRALAAAARRHLEKYVAPETTAVAFARDGHTPTIVAVVQGPPSRVDELLDACAWTSNLFDLASLVQPGAFAATGTWTSERGATSSVVAWRALGLSFTSLTTSQAAAAVLLGRVAAAQRRDAERELRAQLDTPLLPPRRGAR